MPPSSETRPSLPLRLFDIVHRVRVSPSTTSWGTGICVRGVTSSPWKRATESERLGACLFLSVWPHLRLILFRFQTLSRPLRPRVRPSACMSVSERVSEAGSASESASESKAASESASESKAKSERAKRESKAERESRAESESKAESVGESVIVGVKDVLSRVDGGRRGRMTTEIVAVPILATVIIAAAAGLILVTVIITAVAVRFETFIFIFCAIMFMDNSCERETR